MTNLLFFNVLVDAGLMVLAWMVQLIIYPGFLAYSHGNLLLWHKKYTPRITIIVTPLMLMQLGFSAMQVIQESNTWSLVIFLLVLGIWGVTFLLFVPIHRKIDQGTAQREDLQRLVHISWARTLPWTLIFLINLLKMIYV